MLFLYEKTSSLHVCVFFCTSDHGQSSVFSQSCVICASSVPLRQSADKLISAEGITFLYATSAYLADIFTYLVLHSWAATSVSSYHHVPALLFVIERRVDGQSAYLSPQER
jgi:hypothetical protein